MAKDKIRGITIELNADTAGIMDGLKSINKSLSQTEKGLIDVNKLLKFDPDNVVLLAQKQEYLTEAIAKTQEKLQKEKELLENMKSSDNADKTVEQQKALEREIESTTQKLNSYSTQLDNTNKSLEQMGTDSKKAEEGTSGITSALEGLASSEIFSRISEDAKELYEALMGCVEASTTFQYAMAKVETLAKAGSGLSDWSAQIKANAAAVGVSSADLAEAVYQAMSASIASEDAIGFATEATKLAIGGFTEASTAVDIVTTAMNAYGLSMEDATHIMDNLITTQNLGKTTVDELAQQMGRVIPTASAYSVNIDNVSAAYAELTAKGVKTRIATTDLNAMFTELGDSSKLVNEIILEMSGQTFGQFMEAGNSLGDVMQLLWKYAGEDKEAFYGLWSQTSAATGAFNIASDGGERFNEILQEMQSNAGALDENFEVMANTAEMLDKRWESAVENLKISLGDALLPVMDEIKEKGLEVLEPINEFIDNNPELVAALSSMVIGIVGATTTVTALTAAVVLLKTALGDVTGIAAILGATVGVGAFAGLAVGCAAANDSVVKLNKEVQKTKDALDSNSASYSESATNAQNLASRIKELNSVENLNNAQSLALASAVEKWNSEVDTNNQLILDNTGHIIGNTEALEQNIDAALEQYELALKQQELTEIVEAYSEAQEALAEANEKVNEAQEKYNTSLTEGWYVSQYAEQALKDETEARDELANTCEELSQRYADLKGEVDSATASQQEATAEAERAAEMTAAQKQALEELQEAYQKAKESAMDSLEGQRKAFEEFDTSASASVSDIATQLQTQAENMRTYAETIAEAIAIMDKDPSATGVLSYYISQGPTAAGELKNLTEAFTESRDAFDEVVSSFNETESLIDSISTMTSAIETGYTEPLEAAIESITDTAPQITQALTDSFTEQETAADTHKTTMTDTMTNTVTDMSNTVTTNTPTLTTAVGTMMNSAVEAAKTAIGVDANGRAGVFYSLGQSIDDSIAAGITDNVEAITSALQSAFETATRNVNMDGLAQKINQALGEAMG